VELGYGLKRVAKEDLACDSFLGEQAQVVVGRIMELTFLLSLGNALTFK